MKKAPLLLALLLLLPATSPARGTHSIDTVLARLRAYLTDYATRLPATVATEHYEQRAGPVGSGERVVLESEFGIMRLPGGWLGLRDVLSVNGRAVADDRRILEQLFANPSAPAVQQALRIARQNARFNIGSVQRTINDPAVVLELLDARNGSRMRFAKTGESMLDHEKLWTIRFDERKRPTIIRTSEGRDQPVKGTAWVEPATGRLVRAEATIENESTKIGFLNKPGFTATITVVFRDEPRVGFWVPAEMTERYTGDFTSASGEATYSDYRTFTVDTRVIVNP